MLSCRSVNKMKITLWTSVYFISFLVNETSLVDRHRLYKIYVTYHFHSKNPEVETTILFTDVSIHSWTGILQLVLFSSPLPTSSQSSSNRMKNFLYFSGWTFPSLLLEPVVPFLIHPKHKSPGKTSIISSIFFSFMVFYYNFIGASNTVATYLI